jgi:hypothetical protein
MTVLAEYLIQVLKLFFSLSIFIENILCRKVTIDEMTFSNSQNTKEDKAWLYPQMIQAIKKVKDSIILDFSPTKLSNLVNYG